MAQIEVTSDWGHHSLEFGILTVITMGRIANEDFADFNDNDRKVVSLQYNLQVGIRC